MPRTKSHVIETRAKDYLRAKIDSFYSNGDALVRDWNERDYGIDLVVEFFENGVPTGNLAYLQIKATENRIIKNTNSDDISCPGVSASCLEYAKQDRIPFILIYLSIVEPIEFYYIDVQSMNVKELQEKARANSSNRISIKIPLTNKSDGDMTMLFKLIHSYFY